MVPHRIELLRGPHLRAPFVAVPNLRYEWPPTELVGERSGTLVELAGVMKLANIRALGARARKSLRVRVPPPALMLRQCLRS